MGLVPAGILATLVVVFFSPGLFFGQVPIYRDLMVLVLPLRSYAARAVRTGWFPLWTPDLFFGAPFFANYQSALLYPPSAILYLVPLPLGLSLFLGFHVFMAGLGMTRYLQRSCGLDPAPSLFGGVVFAFGGFLTSLIPLTNQLQVATWLPWVLEAGEECVSTGGHRWFFQLTLLLALQWLGGAPEAALLTVALLVGRGTWLVFSGKGAWGRLPLVAAAVILAVGVSCVQLLPAAEYVLRTDRADILPFSSVAAESIHPSSLLQLVVPHTFENGAPGFLPEPKLPLFWSLYVGVAPIALASSAMFVGASAFWTVLTAISTVFALGPHLPILPLVYAALPRIVGLFRFPAKFFLLAHFALAVLAAQGLSRALETQRRSWPPIAAAGALAALGLGLSYFATLDPEGFLSRLGYELQPGLSRGTYSLIASSAARTASRLTALALVTGAFFWLFGRRRLSALTLCFAVTALSFFDLVTLHQPPLVFSAWQSLEASVKPQKLGLTIGERLFHYCTESPGCLPEGAPGLGPWSGTVRIGESVETRAQGLWAALIPDVPLLYGLGAVAGSDGLSTLDQREFYRTLALLPRDAALRMLASVGVEHLIGTSALDLPRPRKVFESAAARIRIYDLPGAAPRVYLAERALSAPDTQAALVRLADHAFRPGRDAVIVGNAAAGTEEFSPGTLTDLVIRTAEIHARVSLAGSGFLVISDTWFPGWEATIDGAAAEILRVNGFLRGLRIPGGEHEVSMRYRPRSFQVGLAISIATGALLLALVAYWLLRKN